MIRAQLREAVAAQLHHGMAHSIACVEGNGPLGLASTDWFAVSTLVCSLQCWSRRLGEFGHSNLGSGLC